MNGLTKLLSEFSKEELKALLVSCKRVQNGWFSKCLGICGNVEGGDDSILLHIIFWNWGKFSGTPYYPVPAPRTPVGEITPFDAFQEAEESETLWSKELPYGRLRWELLDFVIGSLEAAIKDT